MTKTKARKTKDFNPNNCAVTYCINIIGGKWKPIIIHLIRNEHNRYSLMLKMITAISKQTLTNQLRELEADGIVERVIFAEMPPRVEYRITPLGSSLLPIIDAMKLWGRKQMNQTT
ncbi:winged helix-turn-helix transcriptional regulator [Chitinophaga nivalis]|uniref:Helix-turn-helix transcriptional regulator n=1 Tax=Chitinophaga nivalis TaxID=2991709 RepID=A0ABT3IKG5_9BACT|nr:helix-turn-helix domain-containing protein [Chitinophaga nivalis]MCW3465857.1 helix-turn-helix transcriptional regulator [Chitinophaga nivalis]MCW3484452.1 helix-turn-helix transcriptional regulator [Chitinophaga nivalis]